MNFDENISMLSMAFYQVLLVSGPILALALGIGLLIGIISDVTYALVDPRIDFESREV